MYLFINPFVPEIFQLRKILPLRPPWSSIESRVNAWTVEPGGLVLNPDFATYELCESGKLFNFSTPCPPPHFQNGMKALKSQGHGTVKLLNTVAQSVSCTEVHAQKLWVGLSEALGLELRSPKGKHNFF